MKKVLFLIFLSVFFVLNCFAQKSQNYVVTGKIIDSLSNQPLEYATISLSHNSTKEIIGTISDKNGSFKINAQSGTYSLKIEFLSYNSIYNNSLNIDQNINIGSVFLSPTTEALNTVEISGSTKMTTIKLGKTVYDVEQNLLANGGTVNDVLSSIPSISLQNGVPTIRGSKATVVINGRVSSMTKAEALENLQASSIKKIEVITTPSAKYRSDSNGGIINIILKKGKDNGWNGSVTGTGGIKNVFGGGASINYRENKFSFYSNASYFQRERIGSTNIENEYFSNGNTEEYLTEKRTNIRKIDVFNTLLGFDYNFSDNASLNIEGNFANLDGTIDRTNSYNYFDATKQLINTIEQNTYTDHFNDVYDISSTYNNNFGSEGKNLSISIRHQTDKEYNEGKVFFKDLFPNQNPLPDNDELFYDNLFFKKTNSNISYVFPTGKFSSLEFGTEVDFGQLLYDFENEVKFNGDFITNPFNTDKLTYDEDIFSGYAEYVKENDQFYLSLGLRTEKTKLNIDSSSAKIDVKRDFTDLFPSAVLEYNLNENKQLSFYYGRGIQRASYEYLYPFEQQISETTSFVGNIELQPYYHNSIEVSILNIKEESKLTFKPSFYFRNYNEIWQFVTIETGEIINEVPKLITTPVNLGYLNFTGIEFQTSYSPSKKIDLTANLDGRYVNQSGTYEYTNLMNEIVVLDYGQNSFTGSAKFKLNTTIGEGYKFQANYNHFFLTEGAYSERYGYGYLNAAFSKDLFRNSGSLTIAAKDIFNSNKTKRMRWTNDVNSLSDSQWREPSILLTLTFRFNQSKKPKIIDIDKKDDKEKI